MRTSRASSVLVQRENIIIVVHLQKDTVDISGKHSTDIKLSVPNSKY